MGLVTIIIPVYNVEKFLVKCLESVIRQKYRNLEIILVDDGSTDTSGIICDEYALKDNRIQVIHKENAGLSSARNAGLDIAKGEYIYFLDSDDWIEENTINENLDFLKRYNADMVIFGIIREFKDGTTKKSNFGDEGMTTIDIINASAQMNIEPAVWCRLTRKTIYDGIRFPLGLRMEDMYIEGELLSKCSNIVVNNRHYYHYNLTNVNSITANKKITFDSYCLSIGYYRILKFIEKKISLESQNFLCANCTKYAIKAFDTNLLYKELTNDQIREIVFVLDYLKKRKNFILGFRQKVLTYSIQKDGNIFNFVDAMANHIKQKHIFK